MRNQEEEVQKGVVKYLQLKYPKAKYCASLGGIRTSFKQAVKAKATGYVKGFPDLQICVPMERGVDAVQGYCARVTKGLDQSLQVIDDYFNKKI